MQRHVINWVLLACIGLVTAYWFLTSGDNAVSWSQVLRLFGQD